MPGPWFHCRTCQGEEGWMVDGEWRDCPACEGQGGWPDNIYGDGDP
jgi:hypothetical protein